MECLYRQGVAASLAIAALFCLQTVSRADEPTSASALESAASSALESASSLETEASGNKITTVRKVVLEPSGSGDRSPTDGAAQPELGIHSLQSVVDMAARRLVGIDERINDYTCMLIKRERINGKLTERHYIQAKVRRRQTAGEHSKTPFSVYLKFLKPSSVAGREVLYVEDQREGDMLVRRGGPRMANITVELNPTGTWAMQDNLHPITSFGFLNLIRALLDNMREDLSYDDVDVKQYRDAHVGDRLCEHIQVSHEKRQPYFDYHIAHIYIDTQMQVPVCFMSYDWPKHEGGRPELKEEYIFTNIVLNPGLSDSDFDATNPDYKFETLASDDVIAKVKQ